MEYDNNKVNLDKVRSNSEFRALIDAANKNLEVMGYTEHGLRHVGYVSKTTANILRELGFDKRMIELGAIAGFVHDIGNAVNRKNHGQNGAILAYNILTRMKMAPIEVASIVGAIGNHEEETGMPSVVSKKIIGLDENKTHPGFKRKNKNSIKDISNHSAFNLPAISANCSAACFPA